MIPLDETKGDICFTHFSEKDQTQTVYDVTRLLAAIADGTVPVTRTKVQLDPILAVFLVQHRGVERHRIDRLMETDPETWEPIVFCMQADETGLLVDGTHRYVVALLKETWVIPQAVIVAYPDWRPYTVDAPRWDPDSVMSTPSGL
jgi:hypothetical protein